jgi:hypothetical protein
MLKTLLLCFALMSLAPLARAALRDEVRVYTDSIEKKGEWGLEMHFNTISQPRLSTITRGEPRPLSGLILTPELSYGLSDSIEVEFGLMLSKVRMDDGQGLRVAPHLRAKWVPVSTPPVGGEGRWFWGAILEWSASPYRRGATNEDAASTFGFRPIIGYRTGPWLIASNFIFEWPLGIGQPGAQTIKRPEFAPALKILRNFGDRFASGIEYHGEWGALNRWAPSAEQSHTLYWVIERRKPFWMSLGLGYGLNRNSGGLSIKGSLEIPLD